MWAIVQQQPCRLLAKPPRVRLSLVIFFYNESRLVTRLSWGVYEWLSDNLRPPEKARRPRGHFGAAWWRRVALCTVTSFVRVFDLRVTGDISTPLALAPLCVAVGWQKHVHTRVHSFCSWCHTRPILCGEIPTHNACLGSKCHDTVSRGEKSTRLP